MDIVAEAGNGHDSLYVYRPSILLEVLYWLVR